MKQLAGLHKLLKSHSWRHHTAFAQLPQVRVLTLTGAAIIKSGYGGLLTGIHRAAVCARSGTVKLSTFFSQKTPESTLKDNHKHTRHREANTIMPSPNILRGVVCRIRRCVKFRHTIRSPGPKPHKENRRVHRFHIYTSVVRAPVNVGPDPGNG
jgi:hypothetical protein